MEGFWIKLLIVLGLITISGYFTLEAFKSWEDNPTMTSASWLPLRRFPMPAITVCPEQNSKWIGIFRMLYEMDPSSKRVLGPIKLMTTEAKLPLVKIIHSLTKKKSFALAFGAPGWMKDLKKIVQKDDNAAILYLRLYEVVRQNGEKEGLNLVFQWMVNALDFWIEGKSPSETKDLLASTANAIQGNLTLDQALSKMVDIEAYKTFKDLFSLVDGIDGALTIREYQGYLLDFLTNNPYKFGKIKLAMDFWIAMGQYIANVTGPALGVPAPVLHDGFNMLDMKSIKVNEAGVFTVLGSNGFDSVKFVKDPDIWHYYLSANASFIATRCVNHNNQTVCSSLEDYVRTSVDYQKLDQYLRWMQQPVHIDIDSQYFNFPMIPFCWFGQPLYFLGQDVVTDYFNDYNTAANLSNPNTVLKWCNVFRKAFPVKSNCYSINGIGKEEETPFALGKVQKIGPDNGFTIVLDVQFGQSSYSTGTVSHKLYIHQEGTLPDMLNINNQGVDIVKGMKQDITISADFFEVTDAFRDLSRQARDGCILENEVPDFGLSGDFHFYQKYTPNHCIVELIMEEGRRICNCTPWDVADYMGLKNETYCLIRGRTCTEKVWKRLSTDPEIQGKCPQSCSESTYSVSSVTRSEIQFSPYFFDANEKTTFIDTYVKAKFRTLNHFPGVQTIKNMPNVSGAQEPIKKFQKMGVVSINFGPGFGTVLTKDVKASFSDKLGTIGGTFGIFVGASFLTLYEILVDCIKHFKRRLSKRKKSRSLL